MPNWTAQQQDAISDRGHSLIVCAAAGSGKTAVLVERIVQLVCGGCPIEDMLVVTFTNAAAGEMRLRIGEALNEASRERPELGAQAMALSRASISTLHRFCANLLRENFQALGIDPAFRIGDEQECGVLGAQAMEDALYACYEVGEEAFLAADACYEQEELAELALSIYRFMMTRPDPWGWLDSAVAGCSAKNLEGGETFSLLLAEAARELTKLERQCADTLALCRGEMGPMHYEAACEEDCMLLGDLAAAAHQGYAALRAGLMGASFAALSRKKKGVFDEAIAEEIKARRDALKKAVKGIAERFAPTPEEAAQDLEMTRMPLAGIAQLVRTYDAIYRAAKLRRGVMDFNDLEHGALKALEDEQVRCALRERYRYVFVDEYQDSSEIQEAILGSFAREDGWFMVGDVKQSIYRFRQAEPRLFLEKAERYDSGSETLCRRIDLQNNFRSRANVLCAVNAVFERIMKKSVTEIEYDAREALIPGLPMREDDPPAELHLLYRPLEDEEAEEGETAQERELESIEQEALVAAGRIRELVGTPFYDAKLGAERPLAYRDMAVLMRAVRGSAPLAADILSGEGIPVFCDAGEGYFDIPEIRQMMALLRVIDNGQQDEDLLAALGGPALGLTDSELADIRIATPDTRVPYHEAVRRYRGEKDDALAQKLRAFEEKLARWRLCARHQGVDRLIERLYAETGILAHAGALSGGAARQANLHLLTERARSFMQAQGGSLHAFIRYAQRLHAGGDAMSASAIGESEDVVRIMTTHKSKGLEFPVVFVLGMGRKIAGRREARVLLDAQLGAALPCIDTQLSSERDTVLRRAIRIKAQAEQLAEEIRILYVAMTRARERLILIGDVRKDHAPPAWKQDGGEDAIRAIRTPLDMLAPALSSAGADFEIAQEEVHAGDSLWHIYAHRCGAGGVLERRSDEAVRRLIASLENTPLEDETLARLIAFEPGEGAKAVRKTSVSRVIRDEKRAAQEEDVLPPPERLPRFMQEQRMSAAQIGTAFHRAICMLDLDALRSCPSLEAEIAAQLEAMRRDGVITDAEAKAVSVRMLTALFASTLGVRMLAAERLHREWAFTYRRMDAQGDMQLVQGVIDCCFEENGRWVLVDYKTDADVSGAIERHRPQLEIYAQALETLTGMPVSERVLYLVRAGMGYSV